LFIGAVRKPTVDIFPSIVGGDATVRNDMIWAKGKEY